MAETVLNPKAQLELTASAIRKVHQRGRRGVETVTHDEIVALVATVMSMAREALEQEIAGQNLMVAIRKEGDTS